MSLCRLKIEVYPPGKNRAAAEFFIMSPARSTNFDQITFYEVHLLRSGTAIAGFPVYTGWMTTDTMTSRILSALGPALCALLLLGASPAAPAQGAEKEETDQQFLSRIQTQLKRSQRRIDNIEKIVRQKMGTTSGSSDGIGISSSGGYGGTGRDPMSSDLRRMRLDLRTMRKKVDKDTERMATEYKNRDAEPFDRDYWDGYARRLDRDLREMENELRRL